MTTTRTRTSNMMFAGLAAANMLAAVIAWVGYGQTRDPALVVVGGVVTLLCLGGFVSYFHERIKALERTVEELRITQE